MALSHRKITESRPRCLEGRSRPGLICSLPGSGGVGLAVSDRQVPAVTARSARIGHVLRVRRELLSRYDRPVAIRPSDMWRKRVEEEAAEVARGALAPDKAPASRLWPESLRASTDAALATFEEELKSLGSPSDDEIFRLVRRVVLVLNEINNEHVRAGKTGYETGEREELCDYIDASLQESGIDVATLTARREIGRWEITDEWRHW